MPGLTDPYIKDEYPKLKFPKSKNGPGSIHLVSVEHLTPAVKGESRKQHVGLHSRQWEAVSLSLTVPVPEKSLCITRPRAPRASREKEPCAVDTCQPKQH